MSHIPYIAALGSACGQELELGDDGSLVLTLSGIPMLIQWEEEAEAFLLHMDIGRPTSVGGGAVFTQLLGANFLLAETGGTALSYNEYSGMAALEGLVFITSLNGQEFVTRVERFVEQVDVWTARLQEWNQAIEERVEAELDSLDSLIDSELQGETSPATAGGTMLNTAPEAGMLRV